MATIEDTMPSRPEIFRVLLISPFDEDRRNLSRILPSAWQQHDAGTQAEGLEFLQGNPAHVAICESELPDGTWKSVRSKIALMACPPVLVVTSRLADEALWSEVIHLGAYDVLAKPFKSDEVVHVLTGAVSLWKSRIGQSSGSPPQVRSGSPL
jgi:DNA-binding response OmpR family regulator